MTDNKTATAEDRLDELFWSNDILTDNKTDSMTDATIEKFWSNDILTDNKTCWELVDLAVAVLEQ